MVTLQRVKKEELARIRALYLSAFPKEERAPYSILRRRAKRNVDWWSVYHDGQWAGFFYILRERDMAYIFYFAIDAALRGRHIGTQAVEALLRQYEGMRVFLAIEPVDPKAENYEQRVKRKQFYDRCGLMPLGMSVQEGEVVYELLGTGRQVAGAEYVGMVKRWLGWPMNRIVPFRAFS